VRDQEVLEKFTANKYVQRLQGYVDSKLLCTVLCDKQTANLLLGVFKNWFGELYVHYTDCQTAYLKSRPSLSPPSQKALFAVLTLNIGPWTITLPHQDLSNFVPGVCVVIALGLYNHCDSSHLVLHEPKVLFELASGNRVIFSSSCVTHENIPIGKDKQRRSITFYSAGCLFSYKDMGFKNMMWWQLQDPTKAKEFAAFSAKRWQAGWQRFLKFSLFLV
jgi:hypothetical protein